MYVPCTETDSGRKENRINLYDTMKLILKSLIISLLLVSCGRYGARLEGLDAAIARQNEYRDSVERRIAVLGQVFVAAPTDSLRWETARKIYLCSNHYSRDTVFRYQRLMEELASDSRQELFSRMARSAFSWTRTRTPLPSGCFSTPTLPP